MNKDEEITVYGLIPRRFYRIKYRLHAQRQDRWAQLQFLGTSPNGFQFSGRPTIGTVTMHPSDIQEISVLPPNVAKATMFNKTKCPW